MKLLFLTITLLLCSTTHAQEYLYPVGHIQQDSTKLLLLYQKSVHHIELWLWDPITHTTGKALMSSYTPAGVATLPDGSGFSFIDNDTIRIKYLAKRSPKLIPLYEPLYDFTTLQWINAQQCLLSAKEQERFGIYIIDVEGQCWQLLHDTEDDYRYPQLLGNQLFYIKRDSGQKHYIIQATVDLEFLQTARNVTAQDIFNSTDERNYCTLNDMSMMLDCDQRHIAFLKMASERRGFYLEHPATIDRSDTSISFIYYQITKQGDVWDDAKLFTFSIPCAYLLSGDDRLYESILPFVPHIVDNYIYYANCQQGSVTTQLFRFNTHTMITEQLTHAEQSVMAPYTFGNKILYGGVLHDTNALLAAPSAWIGVEGQFCVNIPTLP